jgi:hypothetical protein
MTGDRISGQQQRPFGARMRAPRERFGRSGSRGLTGKLRAAGAAAIGLGLLSTTSPALAEKGGPCHSITHQVSAIRVTLFKSRTLCFSGAFSTAVIGAPEIADVLPITESMLYVQGKKSAPRTFRYLISNGIWFPSSILRWRPTQARCKTRSRPAPAAGTSMSPAPTARLF